MDFSSFHLLCWQISMLSLTSARYFNQTTIIDSSSDEGVEVVFVSSTQTTTSMIAIYIALGTLSGIVCTAITGYAILHTTRAPHSRVRRHLSGKSSGATATDAELDASTIMSLEGENRRFEKSDDAQETLPLTLPHAQPSLTISHSSICVHKHQSMDVVVGMQRISHHNHPHNRDEASHFRVKHPISVTQLHQDVDEFSAAAPTSQFHIRSRTAQCTLAPTSQSTGIRPRNFPSAHFRSQTQR